MVTRSLTDLLRNDTQIQRLDHSLVGRRGAHTFPQWSAIQARARRLWWSAGGFFFFQQFPKGVWHFRPIMQKRFIGVLHEDLE
jgi:hypothetical protein